MLTDLQEGQTRKYWLSSKAMTVQVIVVECNGRLVVREAAPIAKKFIGQPLASLTYWMQGQGGFMMREM